MGVSQLGTPLRAWSRVVVAAVAASTCLAVAASAQAAPVILNPPTFVRQWDPGPPNGSNTGAKAIATDPFGDVYVLMAVSGSGGGSFRVQKYTYDGNPISSGFDNPLTGFVSGGLATDPEGHVYVAATGAGGANLREFTPAGGELADYNVPQFQGSTIAIDSGGRFYANGSDAGGKPALNEYKFSGGTAQLVNSTPYPGSPSGSFFPYNFIGVTTDDAGNVYASGVATGGPFLAKYGPGLSGPTGHLELCAAPGSCFGGFGLAFGASLKGATPFPAIFAGGGYGGGAASDNFYKAGVYATTGDVPSGSNSDYLGSFGPAPVPGGASATAPYLASSPCRSALYILASVFGGPGATYNGNEVQQFDTQVPGGPCATPPVALVSQFKKKYLLKRVRVSPTPCTPCAVLLPSGAFARDRSTAAATASNARRKHKSRAGVVLKFKSSRAADVTFLFTRVVHRRHKKPKRHRLGGFVYAASQGRNSLRFTGVLRNKRPLKPGTYRVAATGGIGKSHFTLVVAHKHHKHAHTH